MSEKKYLLILKTGVFLSLLTLLFAFSGLLFPFVASKQLSFNILIEILLVFYLVFIIKYPAYRPKKSLITYGLLAYFGAIFLSLFVSVDFNLSFWGDIERMLGLFHLLHFLALYFIVISVFRSKEDYYWLFRMMLIPCFVSALMMVFYKTGRYNESILGNRAYLAAFMLFSIFLSLLMIIKHKKWWQKFLFLISLIFSILTLVKADISGSHLGLLAGIFVFLFVFSVFNQNKKIKTIGLSALLIFLIFISSLFYFRFHPVFDGTYLGRALKDFSSENTTLNTRLISWRAAGKYLVDHPINLIFGVGHGNYALIFDKYFDAKFYNFDRAQTYFDRAHNNLVDIGTTTGLMGLLSYLTLMIFLVFVLIKVYNKNKQEENKIIQEKSISIVELSILLAMLSAYFVQNLAVFDSFSSYMYIMFFMAFVSFLEINNRKISENSGEKKIKIKESVLFLFFGVMLLFFIININIKTINTSIKTVKAYELLSHNKLSESYQGFKTAFELNSVLVRDSRDFYINIMNSNLSRMINSFSSEEVESFVVLAMYAVDSNLDYNPNDSLALYKGVKIYELAGRFYAKKGDNEKAVFYNNIALQLIDFAIDSSPQRVPLYYFKSSILLNFGKNKEAIEVLNYARDINPKMPDAYCQLANLYFYSEEFDSFFNNFSVCIENGGIETMNFSSFIDKFKNTFLENENYLLLSKIENIILEKYPESENLLIE